MGWGRLFGDNRWDEATFPPTNPNYSVISDLHGVRAEAGQNQFISFRSIVAARVATTASVPSDMVKLLSLDPGERSMDNLAECIAVGINVDNRQIIARFIFQVRLNGYNVENFLARAIFHCPQGSWIAGTRALFTCKTATLESRSNFTSNRNYLTIHHRLLCSSKVTEIEN
jgi:hypothetical protein